MYEEPSCSICPDDGLYFCRICATRYCCEHLCSHLAVAWESNSWTQRSAREIKEQYESEAVDDIGVRVSTEETPSNGERLGNRPAHAPQPFEVQISESLLRTCSTHELRARYNYYLDAARAYRNELERREVFASGNPSDAFLGFNERGRNSGVRAKSGLRGTVQVPSGRVPKSASRAVEILSRAIRTGCLSVEDVARAFRVNSNKEI